MEQKSSYSMEQKEIAIVKKGKCPKGGLHQFEFTGQFFGKRQCIKCKVYEYIYNLTLDKTKR